MACVRECFGNWGGKLVARGKEVEETRKECFLLYSAVESAECCKGIQGTHDECPHMGEGVVVRSAI